MPEPEIDVQPAGTGDLVLLRVGGDLGETAAAVLRDALTPLLNESRPAPVILDLSRVTACDPAGVGALISAYKQVVLAGGRLVIAAMPTELRQDFLDRDLDRLFTFYETTELAVEDLG